MTTTPPKLPRILLLGGRFLPLDHITDCFLCFSGDEWYVTVKHDFSLCADGAVGLSQADAKAAEALIADAIKARQ